MSAISEGHSHVFLGAGHEQNERKTWAVIVLCSAMMLVEIVEGPATSPGFCFSILARRTAKRAEARSSNSHLKPLTTN